MLCLGKPSERKFHCLFPLTFSAVLTCSPVFLSLTEDYNLELQYRKPFMDIWHEEKDDPVLGPLSQRMGVRSRDDGSMLVNEQELEAAGMHTSFSLPIRYT